MLRSTSCFPPSILLFLFATLVAVQVNGQDDRWGETATDGSGLGLGDATTITWGYVADGTAISPAVSGESSNGSSLINFLDTNIGAGGGGSDYTNRPWHDLFVDIFDRWDSISGLSFNYEPNDSGQAIDGTIAPRGQLGVVADVRIGGHSIDGQSGGNILAYNYFPDHGDMVIDTDNVNFFRAPGDNYLGLRNVLAHEFGHGMGLPHHTANNSRQLMERFVDLSFDGPQIDDIIEAQRRYGDNFEDGAGNDTFSLATDLGSFNGTTVTIGTDANIATATEIAPTQVDFVSIDDDSDTDFFKITLDRIYDMTFLLDMVGPTYNRNSDNGYNLAQQSDLDLAIFAADGTTLLDQSNTTGRNVIEQIDLQLAAGTYFARVTGRDNDAQFYEFSAFGTAVPEPGSFVVLGLLGTLLLRRKRA